MSKPVSMKRKEPDPPTGTNLASSWRPVQTLGREPNRSTPSHSRVPTKPQHPNYPLHVRPDGPLRMYTHPFATDEVKVIKRLERLQTLMCDGNLHEAVVELCKQCYKLLHLGIVPLQLWMSNLREECDSYYAEPLGKLATNVVVLSHAKARGIDVFAGLWTGLVPRQVVDPTEYLVYTLVTKKQNAQRKAINARIASWTAQWGPAKAAEDLVDEEREIERRKTLQAEQIARRAVTKLLEQKNAIIALWANFNRDNAANSRAVLDMEWICAEPLHGGYGGANSGQVPPVPQGEMTTFDKHTSEKAQASKSATTKEMQQLILDEVKRYETAVGKVPPFRSQFLLANAKMAIASCEEVITSQHTFYSRMVDNMDVKVRAHAVMSSEWKATLRLRRNALREFGAAAEKIDPGYIRNGPFVAADTRANSVPKMLEVDVMLERRHALYLTIRKRAIACRESNSQRLHFNKDALQNLERIAKAAAEEVKDIKQQQLADDYVDDDGVESESEVVFLKERPRSEIDAEGWKNAMVL